MLNLLSGGGNLVIFFNPILIFTDEVGALVFDIGSYTVRAGYAGEDCPKVTNDLINYVSFCPPVHLHLPAGCSTMSRNEGYRPAERPREFSSDHSGVLTWL